MTNAIPLTPRSEKAIEYATEEARTLGHGYVGTEHILLGLLREKDGIASEILSKLGLTIERVRNQINQLSKPKRH
jgi:ATP-dependent Clp protease ATP-binding subunit ClpC